MADKSIADVLEEAADLIAAPGAWAQHIWYRDRMLNCFCMIGAVAEVEGVPPGTIERGEFGAAIKAVLPKWCRYLHDFNDAKGRTQSEVVAKLREAAALARASVA